MIFISHGAVTVSVGACESINVTKFAQDILHPCGKVIPLIANGAKQGHILTCAGTDSKGICRPSGTSIARIV